MNTRKSFKSSLLSFTLIAGIMFFLTANANAQTKYDVKVELNEKALFTNCIKIGTNLFIPMEELALRIDGSVTIEAPYKIGPYFKFEGSKVSLIKTGSGKDARLNVKKTGVLSSEVKKIILDGKQHAFLPFEEFVAAVNGTWKYNESTGIYGVTAGGCGACFIEVLS